MAGTSAEGEIDCPACGRPTLSAEGAGEVCRLCGWADELAQRRDPNFAGGPNGIALREARSNVDRFGVAFPPSEAGV
jgi:hypothetical protein